MKRNMHPNTHPSKYLPQRLYFSLSDAWCMSGVFLQLHDGVLIKSDALCSDSQPVPLGCGRCQPSDEQWQQFWQELEQIGVWSWQSEYQNPNVLDGEMWLLELAFAGKQLNTEGCNAYPGASDGPGFAKECAFGQFIGALRRLTGIENFELSDNQV
jgi:hypothetical protein